MLGRLQPVILLFLSAPLFSADIDTVLKSAIGPKGMPSVVAMVATRDRIVYQAAYGEASLQSVFRIFSMTKPVTSVAAMQLVEKGKLDLDAPVTRYLPELGDLKILTGYDNTNQPILRPPVRQPTIRQLLSHTAGYGYGPWDDLLAKYPTTGDFMKAPLLFEPGTKWQYGVSTDVIGRVVERVSGQNLEEYFQQHIFKPLGMTETTFFPGPAMQDRIMKRAIRQSDGTYVQKEVPVPSAISPTGGAGLFSTAADYVRFMQMFLRAGQGVLQPKTVQSMRRNQIGALNVRRMISNNPAVTRDFGFRIEAGDKFGLGFQINPIAYPKGRAANSMAWAGLWNTFFWIDPKSNICAVILMQSARFVEEPAIQTLQAFEGAVYSNKPAGR
jgi:CubicO group peptidase (beta-lactamase class C family)